MLRIAALNDELSEDHFNTSDVKATTKEAQESELFGLYNKALSLDKQGERQQARTVLLEVLSNPLFASATSEGEGSPRQLLALKYSTYKNVASMYHEEEDWDQALQYYLQALLVDESDVTVWYKVGMLALKLDHFLLASHSFQQGLQCNSQHWPCIDQSLTLLYALGNYHSCLYWVSQALERDSGYVKALVLLHQIYREQPSLKQHSLTFFKHCDPVVWESPVTDEEQAEVVEEALEIRQKKRELCTPTPRQNTQLRRQLTQYTWLELGERLVELYDYISSSLKSATPSKKSTVYFSSPVELSDCLSVTTHSTQPIPTPSHCSPYKPPAPVTAGQMVETPGGQDLSEEQGGTTESEMDTSQLFEPEDPIPRGLVTKRRKLWQMQEEWGGKRRSTRVRNVVHRKQEESVNYQELLTKFLPRCLREGRESDPHALTLEAYEDVNPCPQTGGPVTEVESGHCVVSVCDNQISEVSEFIHRHHNNTGVLSIMGDFLRYLAKSALHKWPASLCDVYIKVHNRYRKHIEYPNYFCKDDSEQYIQEMGEVLLLSRELQVDRWCQRKKHLVSLSPRKSPCGVQHTTLGPDFPAEHFSEDLCYLTGLSVFTHILQPHAVRFSLRVFWMQGKYLLLENKTEEALSAFCKVLECLSESETPIHFYLPNIHSEPLISLSVVEREVSSLRRFQSLEEIHRLYEAGDHQRVVSLLQQTFHKDAGQLTESSERHEQLQLLQECLTELEDWKKCVVWSELSLREAVHRYNLTSKSHRAEWMNTISKLMEGINRCLIEDNSAVAALPSKNLVQLTRNLLWLLEVSLESVDPTEPPKPLPWILLFRLVKFEEDKPPSDELPCSLMLLNFAHDCLGRRGWCVAHEGRLLQFVVEELMRELTGPEPHPLKEELEEMLDQCFYCMYGHPNRKTKARHLQDHGVPRIELTWERAQCVFDYFKPKSMPEYDSYRTSTVSADLENLLKRIVQLIPPQASLTGNTIESVTSYIEGTTSHAPSITDIETQNTLVVREIYYLLGDYYFKNKETGKAIKFYLHDLCVNPERFDSWAGMALARASRLEQRLNSEQEHSESAYLRQGPSPLVLLHELKNEPSTIQKQANSALHCFRRALDIDSSNSKLWIEYAALAFQLHSYLSRTLKQSSEFPLPDDTVIHTRSRCAELLTQAEQAYRQAGSGEEEEEPWLQHYMLGKIAEKTGEEPKVFLQHYHTAAEYLHEERAKYPKKITYIHSPPYLSVEALEVFYRLHVSTIKYLMRLEAEVLAGTGETNPGYLSVLEEYTKQSLSSHFALCKEKDKPKLRPDSGKNETDSREAMLSTGVPVRMKTPASASRLDHTYSTMSRLKAQQHHSRGGTPLLPSSDLSQDALSSSSSLCSPSASLSSLQNFVQATPPVSITTPPISITTPPVSINTPPVSITTPPLSSVPSSGSTPLIGDTSFSTPISVLSRVKGVLPTGITPLPSQAVKDAVPDKKIHTQRSPVVSPALLQNQSPDALIHRMIPNSSPVTDVSGSCLQNTAKSSTPKSTDSVASSKTGLNFSVDSILGLSSQPKSDANERADGKTGQLRSQGSFGFEVGDQPAVESEEVHRTRTLLVSAAENAVEPVVTSAGETQTTLSEVRSEQSQVGRVLPQDTNVGSTVMRKDTSKVEEGGSAVKTEKSGMTTEMSAVTTQMSEVMAETSAVKTEPSEVIGDKSAVKAEPTDTSALKVELSVVKSEQAVNVKDKTMTTNKSLAETAPSAVTNGALLVNAEPSAYTSKSSEKDAKNMALNQEVSTTQVPTTVMATPMTSVQSPTQVEAREIRTQVQTGEVKPEMPVLEATEAPGVMSVEDAEVSSIQTEIKVVLEEILSTLDSGQMNRELKEAEELYRQSTKSPPPPLRTAHSIDSNASPPKLTSPLKYSSQEVARLEMPVLEMMETVKKVDKDKEKEVYAEDMEVDEEVETDGKEGTACDRGNGKAKNEGMAKGRKNLSEVEQTTGEAKEEMMDTDDNTGVGVEGDNKVETGVEMAKSDGQKKADVDTEEGDKTGTEGGVRERYENVLRQAMQGLEMCLSRFPHHYKSLYRLADVYAHSALMQDRSKSRDLLLGSERPWQELDHMPCPGLFQERKNANFFQGMWRIPVEEIDRSGSFATHMAKCLRLLFETLVSLRDHTALYQVHTALNRTPEQGKKYLRDTDRSLLASQAYTKCFDIIETKIPDMEKSTDEEACKKFLLDIHRFWQHGVRQQINVKRINQVFCDTFTACTHGKVTVGGISVLEKAIKYCSQLTAKTQGAAPVKSSEPATTSVKQGKSEVVQDARYTKVMTGEPRIQTVDISVQSKKPESSELRRFLTSQAVEKPGPEEELQVVVLDESHIEINISPRKRTPDTGSEDADEGHLNEITGLWEPPKSRLAQTTLTPNPTNTSSGFTKKVTKPYASTSTTASSTFVKQAKVQEKATAKTKTSADSHMLLKKTLQQATTPKQMQPPTQQQVWDPALPGQLGARAMMQQLVLQEQARRQAEAIRQADAFAHMPSASSVIEQMLLHEQASYLSSSQAAQPSTEEVYRQLLQSQDTRRRQNILKVDSDSDCVIVLSSSDSE